MRRWLIALIFLSGCSYATAVTTPATVFTPPHSVAWRDWSVDAFAQARTQHKLILLDLGTQWCHWCHVMDAQTYTDPQVDQTLADHFISLRADADLRPDLANKYEDYGWPATIIFNSNGAEIVKRRGYLPPKMMASILQACVADPTPGPSVTAPQEIHFTDAVSFSGTDRANLIQRHAETYDSANGAWGTGQKFLDPDSVEWSLRQSDKNPADAQMARQTLTQQLHLLDPAWGGVYQYSTDNDWQHPHFEKIMSFQTGDLRIYSLAWAQWHDPSDLHAAHEIFRYLRTFLLAPNGGFFTSQDADLIDGVHSADYFALSDTARRAKGIPRIDTHQFARENGWAIWSLCAYYEATGDDQAMKIAISAADWALNDRAIPGGGFSHDRTDAGGPFAGDTLAMGRAFLELYTATADRKWLTRSQSAADFIAEHFLTDKMPGVLTVEGDASSQEFDENVTAARWANLLYQYTGRKPDQQLAQSAMRYLTSPQVGGSRHIQVGGLLLADDEIRSSPLHITIVGNKSDPAAQTLFTTALAAPTGFKRIEWYDPADGPLPNPDVDYPLLKSAAAFLCRGNACSSPASTPAQLQSRLSRN